MSESWKGLLEVLGGGAIYPWLVSPKDVIKALEESSGHPVVLRLACRVVAIYAEHDLRDDEFDVPRLTAFLQGLGVWRSISKERAVDVGILLVFVGGLSPEFDRDFLEAVVSEGERQPLVWEDLLSVVHSNRLQVKRSEEILLKIYSMLGVKHKESGRVLRLIREHLQKRASDLDNHKTWDRLSLPLPYPRSPLQSRLSGGVPSNPIRIEKIELQDIGGVGKLSMALDAPADGKGQWTLILGPNGSGKTTILRSLVLALRNVGNPSIWPKGAFGIAWQRFRQDGEGVHGDSVISVTLGDGVEHRTVIRAGASLSVSQLPEQSASWLFPIFAYGCRRGSALGGQARQVNLDDDSGPEVATLFDEGADLIQAETWLITLEGDILRNIKSRVVYESVTSSLIKLLDVSDVLVFDKKLWVIERDGGRVPFSCLSDGYLTQAGWFLDLVARWLVIAEKNDVEIDSSFLSRMRGLVLIDEIDLHLHPRWQTEIVTRTRTLLPQMSFVVTTHNPLTLVGASPEEIVILGRDGGCLVASSGKSSPMLLTGGQLYKQYFGVSDIYPSEVGRNIQRLGYLSGNPMRSNDEQIELEAIQQALNVIGIDPGWDVVPRTVGDEVGCFFDMNSRGK